MAAAVRSTDCKLITLLHSSNIPRQITQGGHEFWSCKKDKWAEEICLMRWSWDGNPEKWEAGHSDAAIANSFPVVRWHFLDNPVARWNGCDQILSGVDVSVCNKGFEMRLENIVQELFFVLWCISKPTFYNECSYSHIVLPSPSWRT